MTYNDLFVIGITFVIGIAFGILSITLSSLLIVKSLRRIEEYIKIIFYGKSPKC